MQHKDTHTKTHGAFQRRLFSRSPLFGLLLLSVVHFMIASTFVNSELDIKPSVLILKQNGCELVSEFGIETQPRDNAECKAIVMYETNQVGSAGKIHINDQEVRLADDQVSLVGTLDDHQWTPRKQWLIGWMGMSVLLMLVLLVLMVRASR
jgi:hypothetical protein